ncbi:hypothetical protein F5Y18DRAFT_180406 [Xylariaceae sp. FL1019]|nr:hypothetical protein F5Y18DRAFT_180406 [Xylariaceae sp. FL1019]
MLCNICQRGLEGIADASMTPRLGLHSDIFGDYSMTPRNHTYSTETARVRVPDRHVFGHHKTLESFQASMAQGCVMCNRYSPKATDVGRNEAIERLGYFSVFQVSFNAGTGTAMMFVHYGNSQGGFRLVSCPESDDSIVRTLPSTTRHGETWSLIESWLKQCDEHHVSCGTNHDASLPTWLIEVRTAETGGISFRLVEGGSLGRNASYMTLSHCANVGNSLLSASSGNNLREWQPQDQLPALFREACVAALRLEVQYLWIAELCNADSDLSPLSGHEAYSQRNAAFRSANLSIAALAPDSLFASRESADVVPTIVNLPIDGTNRVEPYMFEFERTWAWRLTLNNEPLITSPQFLVDRLTAHRTLLFGRKQVFWECGEACACELHPDPSSPAMPQGGAAYETDEEKRLFKPTLDVSFYRKSEDSRRQMLLDWYRVVEVMSGKNFEVQNTGDVAAYKLDLLAEITRQVESAMTSKGFALGRYVAGHWESTLLDSLIWGTRRPGTWSTSMPSWSWTSVDAPITFHQTGGDSSQTTWLARLVQISGEVDPLESSSDTTSHALHLRGRMATATLLPPSEQSAESPEGWKMLESIQDEEKQNGEEAEALKNKTRSAYWSISFDTSEDVCDEFFILPIRAQSSPHHHLVSCLAVAPISANGTEVGVYRRIGITSLTGSADEHRELVDMLLDVRERELDLR